MPILQGPDLSDAQARQVVLGAMGLAFVEIRASDDLDFCRKVAELWHNIPAMLARGCAPHALEAELRQKAERQQIQGLVAGWLRHCRQDPIARDKPALGL